MNIQEKVKERLATKPQLESGPTAALVEISIPSKPSFYQVQFFRNPRVGYVEYFGKCKVEIVEILGQ